MTQSPQPIQPEECPKIKYRLPPRLPPSETHAAPSFDKMFGDGS